MLCARAMSPAVSIQSLMQFGTGYGLTKATTSKGVVIARNIDF